ncbi:MAG TPA: hypothetical protein GYA06_13020 [Chloroflexi bacterium]|jgi:hypothetical protein|nr:hypothetical protein [Chloroflexota bacterium]HPO59358.1 hypothetical protein [Anaerolineaceae bacterium]
MNEIELEYTNEIPLEWVRLVSRLHPITAVVVWAVLNNQVTPEVVALASYSPDLNRYNAISTIANGDLRGLEGVTHTAYEGLFEILADVMDYQHSQRLQ